MLNTVPRVSVRFTGVNTTEAFAGAASATAPTAYASRCLSRRIRRSVDRGCGFLGPSMTEWGILSPSQAAPSTAWLVAGECYRAPNRGSIGKKVLSGCVVTRRGSVVTEMCAGFRQTRFKWDHG